MSLSIGIVGLPNVGKSTLFNALLKRQAALAANYPFATIEPNVGIVDVPDLRLNDLSEIVKKEFQNKFPNKNIPEKVIPAVVEFYDIAGLVEGAHKGEGLGNQFLSHIRETDAILHLVRSFEDENVVRAGSTTPEHDREIINTELMLADIQTIDNRLQSKKFKDDHELLNTLKDTLEKGSLINALELKDEEKQYIKELSLLTQKPMLHVQNVDEKNITKKAKNLIISAKVEAELASFGEDEKREYLISLGIEESGLDKIIKESYKILGLQTFFTAGPKEVRAWTIKKGDLAPKAAGVIHTDFERGFIRAETVSFSDLKSCGSWKNAKEKGQLRSEGKDYIMCDGDVVEFRFNV
ncbi:redox-regulated ATPase YchF [Patescibacteria group bacterium]